MLSPSDSTECIGLLASYVKWLPQAELPEAKRHVSEVRVRATTAHPRRDEKARGKGPNDDKTAAHGATAGTAARGKRHQTTAHDDASPAAQRRRLPEGRRTRAWYPGPPSAFARLCATPLGLKSAPGSMHRVAGSKPHAPLCLRLRLRSPGVRPPHMPSGSVAPAMAQGVGTRSTRQVGGLGPPGWEVRRLPQAAGRG
jgi:hypothetical protein